MKKVVECLVVSENYGDLLKYALPTVKKNFCNTMVITSNRDKETKQVCLDNNVEYLVTDDFFESGKEFDKEAALNFGLSRLWREEWILLLDADIVLPDNVRETIDAKDLREDCLYGCQRRICEVKKDFISNPYVYAYDRPAHSMLWPGGFFQLFHSSHPVMMRGTQFVEGSNSEPKS